MPQLDKVTFVLQFFYLLLFFIIIYFSFEFFVLPKMLESLKVGSAITADCELFVYQYDFLRNFSYTLTKELFLLLGFLTLNIFFFLNHIVNSIKLRINTFLFGCNLNYFHYHPLYLMDSLSFTLNYESHKATFLVLERFSITNFILNRNKKN